MINEARSLLLNLSSTAVDLTLPWSEYVPTEYMAVPLPTWLVSLRNLLLGTNPTQTQLNLRVYQYMQLLHSGKYADHITDMDSRITYLPFDESSLVSNSLLTSPNIGAVLAQLRLSIHTDYPVFSSPGEPYTTCQNLWSKHPLGLYQLTGLLLATIYSTRDIRNGIWKGLQ